MALLRAQVGSQMAGMVREHPWSETALGPRDAWSPGLRAMVDLVLAHGFPTLLLWGPELVQIYNDGYRHIMADKHPAGLGQPTRECWPEVWDINEPIYERVRAGETLVFEDKCYPLVREGSVADAWFTLSYSPVREDDRIAGILVSLFETTHEHLVAASRAAAAMDLAAELKQTATLRDLAERMVPEARLPESYEELLSAAIAITARDACTFQVYDPESKSLALLVTKGFGRKMTDHFHKVDASSNTACGRALKTGARAFADFDADNVDIACQMHVEAGYHSAQATPMLSRSGAPIGMLNTHWREPKHRPSVSQLHFLDLLARQAADLIEQRHAEKSLRDSEERLRQFGEASQDVLWIRDADTLQWEYLTPAFETIYGLSRQQALRGDNFRSWIELVIPEDRPIAEDAMQRIRRGEYVTFDYRIRRPVDGAVRWLRNTDFPIIDSAERVALIGGIGHDFTELRAIEHRLTTLMEGI